MNILVALEDGKELSYPRNTTPQAIVQDLEDVDPSNIYLVTVDGAPWDLARPLTTSCRLDLLTYKNTATLEVIRHDCAHILAQAIQELYPGTSLGFGPAITDGFYYDFLTEHRFSDKDFAVIERRMHEIVDRDLIFEREQWTREQTREHFASVGEDLKVEHLADIDKSAEITIYRQGDWLDLCRGPHGRGTASVGHAFKLTKVSGAYWKGDAKGKALQRIYGTAWASQKDLDDYVKRLSEAEARDHRKLGAVMQLYHIQDEAAGSVFWHPKGWLLFRRLQSYIRRRLEASNYQEVNTPQLVDRILWEKSGHWEKFRENMFVVPGDDQEQRIFALKPMNCPCHVQIFRQNIVSYRELPLRLAEFGSCMRNEPSGSLQGLMRVRSFTQDDGHIFCEEDQIESETKLFCGQLADIYKDLGFESFRIKFATRPKVRAGSDEIWDKAEHALAHATKAAGYEFDVNEGEGAFYGPKLEYVLRDALGREWQCGTLQVDFVLPERLDASYVDKQGNKQRPTMLHRAVLGSFERFIGILIEHHYGRLPVWLSPRPVVLASITGDALGYAHLLCQRLKKLGVPGFVDDRNEKIGYKIRQHFSEKVPYIWVLGNKEAADQSVNIRQLGNKQSHDLAADQAIQNLVKAYTPPDCQRADDQD